MQPVARVYPLEEARVCPCHLRPAPVSPCSGFSQQAWQCLCSRPAACCSVAKLVYGAQAAMEELSKWHTRGKLVIQVS